ncbi:MAG: hypothetical protein ABIN20_02265 [candidate division WOR-3 bacterium]
MKNRNFFIFIFLFILFSFFSLFAPITDDEGIPLNGSILLLEGKDIYKDLVKIEGPFTFLVNLPLLKFFPQNLLFPRIFTSLLVSISFLFIFLLSKEILNKKFSLLFIFLFSISTLILTGIVPSHKWYSFILNVFSVYFILIFLKNENNIFLFLSGFLTGLNLLTMINNGLFNFLSLVIFFLIKYKKDFFKILMIFCYGFLLPLILWFSCAFYKGILDDYFRSIYIYVIKGSYTKAQWNYNNDWFNYFNTFKDFYLNLIKLKINLIYRNFITFFVNILPPFIYFISFINLKKEKNSYYFLFLITGFFQFISMFIQGPNVMRGIYSFGMGFLLMCYFLERMYKSGLKKFFYIFLPFFIYFPLKFLTHAEFLIRGKVFFSDKRFLVFVKEEEKRGYMELKKFLKENTEGKGEVFFLDNGTIFYFLYEKEIPVRYDFIEPYLLPFESEFEVVQNLNLKKIKYVIHTENIFYPKDWEKSYIYNFVINRYEKIGEIDFGGGKIARIYRIKSI